MLRGRHLLLAGGRALALWAAWAGIAGAGSLGISPVRVTLAAARTTSALTVVNHGAERAVVQLELVSWSQREGIDVLEPTQDLLATPPIFQLDPGASQIVRVGLRGRAPDGQRELSYRLLVKEVPPTIPVERSGLQMALQVSLPVFVKPAFPAAPALQWQARRGEVLHLSATNAGNVHLQLLGVRLSGREGSLQTSVAGYVLPGQRREWRLPSNPADGSVLHLTAQTDAGELAADVSVDAP